MKILKFGIALLTLFSISTSNSKNLHNIKQYYGEELSQSDLETYVLNVKYNNKILASENLTNINTTITFSDYLTLDEVEEYTNVYGICISQLQARAIDDEGNRITIFTRTDLGFDETYNIICTLLEDNRLTFIGFTSMNCLIDSSHLNSIQDDARTFIADTSSYTSNINEGSLESKSTNTEIEYPQSIIWELEDLNNQ